jgi:mannose-1-phosphate guanylyltransferase/mannose-6-phosphate isomerase
LGDGDLQINKPLIVSNEEHRFLASEQLREAGMELGAALLEPVGRNTAGGDARRTCSPARWQ